MMNKNQNFKSLLLTTSLIATSLCLVACNDDSTPTAVAQAPAVAPIPAPDEINNIVQQTQVDAAAAAATAAADNTQLINDQGQKASDLNAFNTFLGTFVADPTAYAIATAPDSTVTPTNVGNTGPYLNYKGNIYNDASGATAPNSVTNDPNDYDAYFDKLIAAQNAIQTSIANNGTSDVLTNNLNAIRKEIKKFLDTSLTGISLVAQAEQLFQTVTNDTKVVANDTAKEQADQTLANAKQNLLTAEQTLLNVTTNLNKSLDAFTVNTLVNYSVASLATAPAASNLYLSTDNRVSSNALTNGNIMDIGVYGTEITNKLAAMQAAKATLQKIYDDGSVANNGGPDYGLLLSGLQQFVSNNSIQGFNTSFTSTDTAGIQAAYTTLLANANSAVADLTTESNNLPTLNAKATQITDLYTLFTADQAAVTAAETAVQNAETALQAAAPASAELGLGMDVMNKIMGLGMDKVQDLTSSVSFRDARMSLTGRVDGTSLNVNGVQGKSLGLDMPLFVTLKGNMDAAKFTNGMVGSAAYRWGNTLVGVIQGYANKGEAFGNSAQQLESSVVASQNFGAFFIEGQVGALSATRLRDLDWSGMRSQVTLGLDTTYVSPFVQVGQRQLTLRDTDYSMGQTYGNMGLDMSLDQFKGTGYTFTHRLTGTVGYAQNSFQYQDISLNGKTYVQGRLEWSADLNMTNGVSLNSTLGLGTASGNSFALNVGLTR